MVWGAAVPLAQGTRLLVPRLRPQTINLVVVVRLGGRPAAPWGAKLLAPRGRPLGYETFGPLGAGRPLGYETSGLRPLGYETFGP